MTRVLDPRAGGRTRLLHERLFMNEIQEMKRLRPAGPGELVVDSLDERGQVRWRAFCSSYGELEALARESSGRPAGRGL